MAIPSRSCYHYDTVLHADPDHNWVGVAEDDGSASLLGSRPSVVVTNGRVSITRRWPGVRQGTQASRVSFDGGEALKAVLRQGDRLACWRGGTAEIGLSVSRAGSLMLGLGTLSHAPASDVTVDHDPRVEETELARKIAYIDRPGTRIAWLDPDRPNELEAQLRQLEGDLAGAKVLAIVARTDDWNVSHELNRRTMGRHRPGLDAAMFLRASERFSGVEDWLQYARGLPVERPSDLWLRVRHGTRECQVPEGTTMTFDGWLVHVLRVYQPGLPSRLSQLGLVRAETGVTAAVLESSTAAIAMGLTSL